MVQRKKRGFAAQHPGSGAPHAALIGARSNCFRRGNEQNRDFPLWACGLRGVAVRQPITTTTAEACHHDDNRRHSHRPRSA